MEKQKNPVLNDPRDDEIDLLELLYAYKRRLWLIMLAAVIGFGLAGAYTKFVITPQYTSTAIVYVLSKETTLTSLADLQIGTQLTKDYSVMVTSRPVLEEVIEKQKLNMNYRQLRGKISINNPTDTRILELTVTDASPERAKAIVDQVAKSSSSFIGDMMEMVPPKIIEYGETAQTPSSPNTKKNAVMGGLLFAAAVCGLITVQVLMNDTVSTEEDVEKYLGLSVLAEIPDFDAEEKRGGLLKKKKKPKKRAGKRA